MDEITFHQDNYFSAETSSPKRDRDLDDEDDTNSSRRTLQSKRLRKINAALPPAEKDRTRGRYACLGHRMKHKRCPLDCPDRRPKSAEQMESSSPAAEEEPVVKPIVVIKNRASRSSAKKNVLKLEDCIINKSHPVAVSHTREPSQNWDSVAWEGLSWDEHACLKDENFTDLKSSSHWEESKHASSDDLTKFEEEDIIDSWLNEEFTSADDSEKSASDPEMERRHSPTYMAVQCVSSLPKILLTKDMIERWINEPYFNRLLTGCLVRVQVGEYMGSPIHRIGNVEDVVDTCYYPYTLARGGQSTKGVSVQMGISLKKTFPILSISNHPPTEQEYRTWHDEMERSGLTLDPLELQQKEEIVRVLHTKYPMEYNYAQQAEPLVNEPAVWTSC